MEIGAVWEGMSPPMPDYNGNGSETMIQQALQNPTLADSPSFSLMSPGATPSTTPDPTPKDLAKSGLEDIESMGGDEIFALLGDLLNSSRSDEGADPIEGMLVSEPSVGEKHTEISFDVDADVQLQSSSTSGRRSTPSLVESSSMDQPQAPSEPSTSDGTQISTLLQV